MYLIDFLKKATNKEYLIGLEELCLVTEQGKIKELLHEENLNTLCLGLSSCANLQTFILEFSFIGVYKGINYSNLFRSLQGLPKLTKISFASNAIGALNDQDFDAFINFIINSNSKLEYINLIDNDFYMLIDNDFKKLCDAIESCEKLQQLFILTHNDLLKKEGIKFKMLCNCLINLHHKNLSFSRAESFNFPLSTELKRESHGIQTITTMFFDKLSNANSPTLNGLLDDGDFNLDEVAGDLSGNLLENSNFIPSKHAKNNPLNSSKSLFAKCNIM